jgi:HK97 family phage prohead protease
MTWTSRLIDGGGAEAYIVAAGLTLSEVETDRGYTMLHGKAAPYNEVAYRMGFKEVWADGLFDESIAGLSAKLPLMIWHDDMTWPLGSHQEWDSRPGDGLYGTWLLDRGPEAQRAAQMAADGHLSYLSVGYGPTLSKAEFENDADYDMGDAATWPTITRLKARLMETSVVPVPLYHSAQIMLVACAGGRPKRHRAGKGHAEVRPKLDRWRDWRSSI